MFYVALLRAFIIMGACQIFLDGDYDDNTQLCTTFIPFPVLATIAKKSACTLDVKHSDRIFNDRRFDVVVQLFICTEAWRSVNLQSHYINTNNLSINVHLYSVS